MDSNNNETIILIFLGPRPNIWELAAPIDAAICPEFDQDNFCLQIAFRQWLRIEPSCCAGKRIQFGSCRRGGQRYEIAGRGRHSCCLKEMAATNVDSCRIDRSLLNLHSFWAPAHLATWARLMPDGLGHFCGRTLAPTVKFRQVTSIPSLSNSRSAEIPIRSNLPCYGTEVVPEVIDRRTSPEPIAVVEAVDLQAWFENECVRDHRVVVGIGVLLDVEVLLNLPFRVGEEGPLSTHGSAELLQSVVVVRGNRCYLGVRNRNFRVEGGERQMLLVLLWTIMAAGESEDQRVITLQFTEAAQGVRVIGQLVVGKDPAGHDIRSHFLTPSMKIALRIVFTWAVLSLPARGPCTRRTRRASSRRVVLFAPRAGHARARLASVH